MHCSNCMQRMMPRMPKDGMLPNVRCRQRLAATSRQSHVHGRSEILSGEVDIAGI